MIRNATLKDIKSMVEIDLDSNDSLNKLFDYDKKWLADFFRKKMKKVDFYLYDGKGIIGFINEFHGYKTCEIYWLAVDKHYQQKGIATKLIKFIEDKSKKQGYRAIYLYTHPIHTNAIRLYQKLGYKKINEFPHYYSNGDKSLLFGKQLLKK